MKFNKFAIVALLMLQFGILHCMQAEDIEPDMKRQQIENQDSVELNEYRPVPTLFDTIILSLAKQASEIYGKDGYDKMDEYIKNIATNTPIQEMYGKIISCMTKNFNRPYVFAGRLIDLHAKDSSATMELFCNLDDQAKVSVVECLMDLLFTPITNLHIYDEKYETFYITVSNLLILIFTEYCNIDFYNKILGLLDAEVARLGSYRIYRTPDDKLALGYSLLHDDSKSIIVPLNMTLGSPENIAICRYYDSLKMGLNETIFCLTKKIVNIIVAMLVEDNGNAKESDGPCAAVLGKVGEVLLSLFYKYTYWKNDLDSPDFNEDTNDILLKIKQEKDELVHAIGKIDLQRVIDYLVDTKFTTQTPFCSDFTEFIWFIYPENSIIEELGLCFFATFKKTSSGC